MTGTGLLDIQALYSYGTIQNAGGTLTVTAAITGAGKLEETGGGTLVLNGSIASGQHLSIGAGTIVTSLANAGLAVTTTGGQTGSILQLTGGGSGTLNAADTNLTVQLAQAGTLSLSLQGFLTADGSTGADTLVAEAAGQILDGEGGGDTLIGAAATGDTFLGSAAQLNEATIGDFAGTDVIDVTDLLPGAGLHLTYTQGAGQGTLTLSEGTQSTTITLLGAFSQSQFSTSSDGASGVLVHIGT
jgi:hypothetical protein